MCTPNMCAPMHIFEKNNNLKTNYLTFYYKKLAKVEHSKPEVSRKKK